MRILVATQAMATVGGTETYVVTVADHLIRLGHDVCVYAPRVGEMAELARDRGVDVRHDAAELGTEPGAILAQDGGVAYELAERWPAVPQVFVCHSELFDVQQPPLVPGLVDAVVVMNDRTRQRVEALAGDFKVVRLRQPVDTERLVPRRIPSATPRRALLLGNYLTGEPQRLIVDTWGELGVEVVQVGTATRPTLTPESDIAEADIVVGKGRVILDAMSCGRPAYVYDMWGGDGWVTEASFEAMEANGIGGQAFPGIVDADRLRADLAAYDADMGRVNRLLATSRNGARAHAQALVELASGLLRETPHPVTEAAELARLVRLRWRAEAELLGLRQEFQAVASRADSDVAAVLAECELRRDQLRLAAEEHRRLDAELFDQRALLASVQRRRDKARARGRRFKARNDALLATSWVRLGRSLGLVRTTGPSTDPSPGRSADRSETR